MKLTTTSGSMRRLMARALSVTAIAALSLGSALPVADAADYGANQAAGAGQLNARFLPLGIGKSVVIDLPRDVKDVLVADPKIANAVVRSAQRAYIIGATVGQTNIIFFDSAGQQIAAYDIAVTDGPAPKDAAMALPSTRFLPLAVNGLALLKLTTEVP